MYFTLVDKSYTKKVESYLLVKKLKSIRTSNVPTHFCLIQVSTSGTIIDYSSYTFYFQITT